MSDTTDSSFEIGLGRSAVDAAKWCGRFCAVKRALDILVGLTLLAAAIPAGLFLLLLNPFLNRGPLLFSQDRMGLDCKPIHVWKFRSMTSAARIERGPYDAVETTRITPLGQFIRRARIDELPQGWNILKGDMSLIGPRPDFIEHARVYVNTIPGYAERHAVRPGITGLAQVVVGYVEDAEGVAAKVRADLEYVRTAGFLTDTRIALKTIRTVLGLKGA